MTTSSHDFDARTIRVSALLVERFSNPDVAAYNRSRSGGRHRVIDGRPEYIVAPTSERRKRFWRGVGCAITAAYVGRGCPTSYERAVRCDIDAARAVSAKAGEQL